MDREKYRETLSKMDLKSLAREKSLINNNIYILREEARERTMLILEVMNEKRNMENTIPKEELSA